MDNITGMSLPHFDSLEAAISSLLGGSKPGGVSQIIQKERITGGDINLAYRLGLSDGSYVFMKTNELKKECFFKAEAAGLAAIAQSGAVGTPRVICSGTDNGSGANNGRETAGGFSFLFLEYIQGAKRGRHYWETFARELAALHKAPTAAFTNGGKFGFFQDNYIGSREQHNKVHDSWVSFFRDCRLEPQFRQAAHYFSAAQLRKVDRLLSHLDEWLLEPEHPSLLHGDLWSGNVITGNDGKAWMIDPAAYVGHAEADLAMTELFGGFPRQFYEAYREVFALQPGYERRRDLYNLYQLLNHLNMFGSSYLSSVIRTIAVYFVN